MSDETRYVLNRNEGVDTLHRNGREECNLDDATWRERLDEATALALRDAGEVRLCGHCWPPAEDPA